MSLYLKYRPTEISEVIGNAEVLESIENALQKDFPHSILLTGPTGCGKTTTGRIIANRLGAKGGDIIELDFASLRGIDSVRDIIHRSQFKPIEGKVKVWVIDEVHKATNDAQNAMLKILEDTPKHVYFILCTTDPQKLIATIKGRCQTFEMRPLSDRQMMGLLRSIVKAEEESLVKVVYDQIIMDSQGHPRNAIQILEQVLNVEPDKRLETARRSAEKQSQSIELCRALLQGSGWRAVSTILKGLKDEDPESIRRHVLGYCQSVLLNGDEERAGRVMEAFIEPFYNTGMPGLVFACYDVIKN
jgi:DNA polymerase III subunit gamma/tau